MEERKRLGGWNFDRIMRTVLSEEIQLAFIEILVLILHVVTSINKRMVLKLCHLYNVQNSYENGV